MNVAELAIPDAFEITPAQHRDGRGVFLEWYRHEALTEAVGHPLRLAQANCSVSMRGSIRGVHFADVPPGQAKYVTCVSGAIIDVVVDLRTGSPSFGRWNAVRLDDQDRKAVYLAEGLGHAFAALSEQATVVYMCSEVYRPDREHAINPFDTQLAIDWDGILEGAEPVISDRDRAAPTLEAAVAARTLPEYEQCLEFYRSSSK